MTRLGTSAGAVLAALVLAVAGTPTPASGEDEPRVLEVVVGEELSPHLPDDRMLSAVSLRFFPEDIRVHRGDVVRFTSHVRLQTIALLPPHVKEPQKWVNKHAFDLRAPWYPVTLDPDEAGVKVNNAVAFPPFPPCGAPGRSPCRFPLPPHERAAQDTRWGFGSPTPDKEVSGVLGSGLSSTPPSSDPRNPTRTLDFAVQVDADPGTELHVVSLFAKQGRARILVVPDDEPLPSDAELSRARHEHIRQDVATALAIDARYANHHSSSPGPEGTTVWDALAGVEEGPVAVRQSYPRRLEIRQGDTVRWSPRLVENLVHTVTLPSSAVRGRPFFSTECDLDTDHGTVGDVPSVLPAPLFCPGGPAQVEFDLNELMFPSGNGAYTAAPDEVENSGVLGMAPDLVGEKDYPNVEPRQPYSLLFDAPSGPDGFEYWCALHGEMHARVVVRERAEA